MRQVSKMDKEYLEAFENLKKELYYSPNQIPDVDKWHEIIEEALINYTNITKQIEEADYKSAIGLLVKAKDNLDSYTYNTILEALLKAQEPKQYLKWEDLDFKKEEQTMKVLLNGKEYRLSYFTDGICKVIDLLTNNGKYQIYRHVDCYSYDVQFFNDLHLERVE